MQKAFLRLVHTISKFIPKSLKQPKCDTPACTIVIFVCTTIFIDKSKTTVSRVSLLIKKGIFFFIGNNQLYQLFMNRSPLPLLCGYSSFTAAFESFMFIAQPNAFFNIVDHLALWIKREFFDISIPEMVMCCSTKISGVINCINDHFLVTWKKIWRNQLSLLCQIVVMTQLLKMLPVAVGVFGMNFNHIMTELIDLNPEGANVDTTKMMFSSDDI